jgi:Xaa-Pro aminopeptidase
MSFTEDLQHRLDQARSHAAKAGIDALIVSPGPDLRYLTGYDAIPLERLTALVLPAEGEAVLVVPKLERPAALASHAGDLDLTIVDWAETDDPYALIARMLPSDAKVALDNHMWAEKVLRLRAAAPSAVQSLAGDLLRELRMRKSADEVASLKCAGEAIDRVHAEVGQWLRAGRTEREVGRDIADAIIAAGHVRVDFVIVASGPNGASPHHELSDRVIEPGDAVVVDIGGTMPDGYCSDETRMYSVGQPSALFLERYEVLQAAQLAAVEHVRPGVTCESVDAAARRVLDEAGLGDLFIHRTGHGIGLESHEEPYIVSGNTELVEEGFAFSIEPGFYESGVHGARIEDIVVCGAQSAILMNERPRSLIVVD